MGNLSLEKITTGSKSSFEGGVGTKYIAEIYGGWRMATGQVVMFLVNIYFFNLGITLEFEYPFREKLDL